MSSPRRSPPLPFGVPQLLNELCRRGSLNGTILTGASAGTEPLSEAHVSDMLRHAICAGCVHLVHWLIQYRDRYFMNRRYDDATLLFASANCGHLCLVRYFIEQRSVCMHTCTGASVWSQNPFYVSDLNQHLCFRHACSICSHVFWDTGHSDQLLYYCHNLSQHPWRKRALLHIMRYLIGRDVMYYIERPILRRALLKIAYEVLDAQFAQIHVVIQDVCGQHPPFGDPYFRAYFLKYVFQDKVVGSYVEAVKDE